VQLAAQIYAKSRRPFRRIPECRRFFRKYAVVGDDIVIAHKGIATSYEGLLMDLEIPVNKSKTLSGCGIFEFCKRIYRDGNLQGFPSLNGIGTSVRLGDPAQYYELCSQYHIAVTYSDLASLFGKRRARTFLRMSPHVNLKGQPELVRIPIDVMLHGNRSREIERSFKNPSALITPENADPADVYLSSDGTARLSPWVERLNYCIKIQDVFNDFRLRRTACGPQFPKLKKKAISKLLSNQPSPWDIALFAKANVFYLSYIRSYLNSKRGHRKASVYKQVSNRDRLCHYIMTRNNKWNTLEKLNLYKIDPLNSRSMKIELAVEDSLLEESLGLTIYSRE
jgi:hypothetical protein